MAYTNVVGGDRIRYLTLRLVRVMKWCIRSSVGRRCVCESSEETEAAKERVAQKAQVPNILQCLLHQRRKPRRRGSNDKPAGPGHKGGPKYPACRYWSQAARAGESADPGLVGSPCVFCPRWESRTPVAYGQPSHRYKKKNGVLKKIYT